MATSFVIVLYIVFAWLAGAVGTGFEFALLLLFVSFAWWLGKRFDSLHQRYLILEESKKQLEEDNRGLLQAKQQLEEDNNSLQKSKEELQQLYKSLEITIFSYDKVHNHMYVSKGVENIIGYEVTEFNKNPNLIKEIIYKEDVTIFNENEQKLNEGKSIQVKHRIVTPNDEIRWVHMKATPIQDSFGDVVKINGTLLDITAEKQLERKLKQLAYYDNLTDLPNRTLLQKHLKKVLARSKRHNHRVIIAFIDLDGFKKVNDKLGHDSGDILLQEVATRLNNSVREEDLIARMGGDEFIMVFEETEKEEVAGISKRILANISKSFEINDQEVSVSPSIGISMFPEDGEDSNTLIKNADTAMYVAKSKGKSTYQFYDPAITPTKGRKFDLFDKIVNTFKGD
ncbi:sensor domain-containing diguanylate cyclase [Desertibacillus haloalkaliphilus]|uniref:sensor domain-containing diguanylate cyclase n=1 Tax=Desertibacillus haloalkaliphilus TaxID=1328930 RepID=UPI001C276135|nr:sensor domain-containing diguanylate cyclase [Desertibacillus haloalkaliphilus]MBU8906419.1 sensor domain-containing diguanylate cyclase [Desertibacillus haloalkaliphilus]